MPEITIRKLYSTDLTDEEWERIKEILPSSAKIGRPRKDDREVINGVFYVLSNGCNWKDLPHDIVASPSTCHERFKELKKIGIWQEIIKIYKKIRKIKLRQDF